MLQGLSIFNVDKDCCHYLAGPTTIYQSCQVDTVATVTVVIIESPTGSVRTNIFHHVAVRNAQQSNRPTEHFASVITEHNLTMSIFHFLKCLLCSSVRLARANIVQENISDNLSKLYKKIF